MSCKMLMHEINEPMPVDRHTLENIAHVLKVPLLVEVQLPGSLEERNQEPHLRRVAQRIAGKALIVKLDAKEEHEMAWALGVRAVPTLLIIRGLKVLHSYEGLVESSLLEEWLRQAGRM